MRWASLGGYHKPASKLTGDHLAWVGHLMWQCPEINLASLLGNLATSDKKVLDTIITFLKSDEVEANYLEMKNNLSLTPEDVAYVDQYFRYKVNSLIESLQDVCFDGDETELQRLLSHIWIEFRMEWIPSCEANNS